MAIAQYFAGSLAVAALMGVVVLALCLIFGVPLAPLAALWAMITDLIPQVGGFLGGALLGLLALTQGAFVFVVVVGLYGLYLTLENHVISPAVVGHAVDVSPPTSMLATLIGGAAAGVAGALVATPLVGATKQLYLQLRWGQQPFVRRAPTAARPGQDRLLESAPPPPPDATRRRALMCRQGRRRFSSSSSRSTAVMRARWVNAWGKLPTCCPVGSISSE